MLLFCGPRGAARQDAQFLTPVFFAQLQGLTEQRESGRMQVLGADIPKVIQTRLGDHEHR